MSPPHHPYLEQTSDHLHWNKQLNILPFIPLGLGSNLILTMLLPLMFTVSFCVHKWVPSHPQQEQHPRNIILTIPPLSYTTVCCLGIHFTIMPLRPLHLPLTASVQRQAFAPYWGEVIQWTEWIKPLEKLSKLAFTKLVYINLFPFRCVPRNCLVLSSSTFFRQQCPKMFVWKGLGRFSASTRIYGARTDFNNINNPAKGASFGYIPFCLGRSKQQETRRDNVIYITSKGFMAFLDYYKIHQALS